MSEAYAAYRRPVDLGTPPASESTKTVQLTVDGESVTVPEGTTVIRAAALAGINIPKLCASDMLEPFGSCRLCLVEIEGAKGLPASCTTEAAEGMRVTTQNPRLAEVRRNVMELYISDHPLDCLTCPTNGDCELQDMAGTVGLRDVRYGYAGENHLDAEKDTSNPYFTFDPSKCIVCSRCVRACEEVQGTYALTIDGRGFDSKVVASQNQPFLDSECVSCGACVQACPTATLTEKSLIDLGQPEHSVITTCAYCGVGCSFRAEMKGEEVVKMIPNKEGEANHGHSCVKGRFAFGYATHKDRITAPLIRESIRDPWQEVSWEDAIDFAARKLKGIRAKYGPNSIGGITSSRCTNEETYLVQKTVRAAFGNNNVDTCARVCHSPTGYGLKTTLGESAGTQAFDSVLKADEIHPHDAEQRGIEHGDWVGLKSRAGETVLRADITERVQPGVVYTTFHHPESGANVVTTDNSDWATNCPEYKVTAVQAYKVTQLSDWQQEFEEFTEAQLEFLRKARTPATA